MTFILLFFPQDSYKHRAKCFVLCNCIGSACFVVHVRPLWWCPACKIDLNVVTVAAFRLSFLKNSDKEQLQQFIIVIISRLVIFTRIMIANLCLRLFAVKTRVIFTLWLLVQKYSVSSFVQSQCWIFSWSELVSWPHTSRLAKRNCKKKFVCITLKQYLSSE